MLRLCARQRFPALKAVSGAVQRRGKADVVRETAGEYDRTPAFDSPFKSTDSNPTTNIPKFGHYMSKKGETPNKTFQYFMVGSMGLLAAAGAKATVQGGTRLIYPVSQAGLENLHQRRSINDNWLTLRLPDFLVNMSASADVLAQAKVEVDLNAIPEGKNVGFGIIGVEAVDLTCLPGHHKMAR